MNQSFEVVQIALASQHPAEIGEGLLSVMEVRKMLPFPVDRFFTVTGMARQAKRGGHANKIVNEAICCLNGTLAVHTLMGGIAQTYVLATPAEYLFIPAGTWLEIEALEDKTSYCVLADHSYAESAPYYIRDFDHYRALVSSGSHKLSSPFGSNPEKP